MSQEVDDDQEGLLEREFRPIDAACRSTLAAFHSEPPEQLFHYTTSNGLLGMLGESSLWATNIRFLNDSSEIDYGRELFTETFNEIRDHSKPVFHSFLDELKKIMPFTGILPVFAFCLSSEGNLLSQWRAYSESGTGYSIGFDSRRLTSELECDFGNGLRGMPELLKVSYSPDEQKHRLRAVIDACLTPQVAEAANRPDATMYLSNLVSFYVERWIVSVKHPTFSEEQEWRLVFFGPVVGAPSEFRTIRGFLVPYVVARSRLGSSTLLPVRSITYGPRLYPELNAAVVAQLLRKSGYKRAIVADSGIPLRQI